MDSIPLIQFDIRGTNPVNTISGEKWALTDKTLHWYLPDGSPFFGDIGLVVMYDQMGAVMLRGRDYYVEGEFQPFCILTGRPICSYVQIADTIIQNNDFVTIDYQSLGAYFVPRSKLQSWLGAMNNSNVPVPWSKVFGVPATLPPELHIHDIKTEITDWYDFTQFFQTLEGITNTTDPSLNNTLTGVVTAAYLVLDDAKTTQMNQLSLHDNSYINPHNITPFTLGLDQVDNFATATLADDLAGVANNLFSTPNGVIALASANAINTDAVAFKGIFPISYFQWSGVGNPVYAGTGWNVLTQSGITLMVSGTLYTVPANSISLLAIDPSPQNKTFYMYITIQDDAPVYILSEIALRKSGTLLRVANIVTTTAQILSVVSEQPCMVGDLLISHSREGGIIPVSTGFPQDLGTFNFLQPTELLP